MHDRHRLLQRHHLLEWPLHGTDHLLIVMLFWPVRSDGTGKQRAGKPPQLPAQQSAGPVHGAPVGAQASRQASLPVRLGTQTPEQQSVGRAHIRSALRQTLAVEQRLSALHRAAASQHSAVFLQATPVALQPGTSAQRRTPSGTDRQVPEQQSSLDWQRSSLGKQPPAPWQRPSVPHTPEQQSLAVVHRSEMILQPGGALQLAEPLALTWQSPEQQSVALLQVSPATRQPLCKRHPLPPSTTEPHWPPQHSSSLAQVSPAAWHVGPGAAHLPASQRPPQQSLAIVQAVPLWAQIVPPHVPAAAQPSPQQAPARLQSCSVLVHPTSEAQESRPLLSCWQRYEQQSSGRWQSVPSARHREWPQIPLVQDPEQHRPSFVQASPSPAQWTSTGVLASSTSRTQPTMAIGATSSAKAIALRMTVG